MTITTATSLTEIGTEGAAAVRDMLVRAIDGKPVAMYVEQDPLPWTTVHSGGWDALGIPEADGGPGASLRDLAEVARAWGEVIAPSPLIVTIMAKRFSEAAREHQGPVSFGIRTRSSGASTVIPFGATPDTMVLNSSGGGIVGAEGTADDYAPSLRLAEGSIQTSLTSEQARELAIVWAAEASGCARRMLDTAVAYAKERQQFDQPIGKFQVIKHYLANAQMLTELSETAVLVACTDPSRIRSATTYAFESSLKVAETAVQVHGGLGFTWEMGLHFYLRHISTLRELTASLEI